MKKMIIIFILLIPFVNASISINKQANTEIYLGDEITVNIYFKNFGSDIKEVRVFEMNDYGSEKSNGDIFFDEGHPDYIALAPSSISWEFTLNPDEIKHIFYSFYPKNVGKQFIQETIAYYNDQEIKSEILEFNVECNNNNICESKRFENINNCPHDCQIIEETKPLEIEQKHEKKDFDFKLIYLIGTLVIAVCILTLVLINKRKNKPKKEDYSEILNRLQK
jgi:hypothetical protein